MASSSARPALTIVESWRVKSTSSLLLVFGPTLKKVMPPPTGFSVRERLATSSTRIGTRFWRRSSASASLLSPAWIVPSTVCPPLFLAAYL
jgi:hypothetical protein